MRLIEDLDDLQPCFFWHSNVSNNPFIVSARPDFTDDKLKKFIKTYNASPRKMLLGIFTQIDNCHIGNIKLDNIDMLTVEATFGILIGNLKYWGIDADSEVIEDAITTINRVLQINDFLLRIESFCHNNTNVYMKLGFKRISKNQINEILKQLKFAESIKN